MTDIPDALLTDLAGDAELRRLLALSEHPLYTFQPREDRPEKFDEQSAFVESQAVVSVALGGNASGKTSAAALKAARFMLHQQQPPRRDTPFWVVSDSLWQVSEICWRQGLQRFVPGEFIDWPRVVYQSAKLNFPSHVPLKPWPGSDNNWLIEFRSSESGRAKFQGVSIGGAWFSEQFAWEILEEVLRGLRDTWYPGSVIIECTPVDPDLSIELESLYDAPPDDWAFYRLNTDCNDAVSDEWRKSFFGAVSDELEETRRTGAFASFQGVIYQSFNPKVHLVGDDVISHPDGVTYFRGVDWGESAEHPFVCLWAYRDNSGNWYVFDEFVDHEAMLYEHRCEVIRERHPWPPHSIAHSMTFSDPSRPGLISEFNIRGIPTCSAINKVEMGIEHVRSLLKIQENTGQPKLFIHKDNCPTLARQMRTHRWLKSSGKGLNPRVARPEPLKRNDDCCDALRYMVTSADKRGASVPTSTRREPLDQMNRRHGIQFKRPQDRMGRDLSYSQLVRGGFSQRFNRDN